MNNEMQTLYETVMERKDNPEEGSYTCYLFSKGEEKILKKVGEECTEECTEVIIASLNQPKEALIAEMGDLLYHLSVLMVQKGISWAEVEAELEKRSQKKHNLKAERRPIEQY